MQMMTPQFGFSAVSVSLSSFARAIPSCRFMFIFQLPATIFFLMLFFVLRCLICCCGFTLFLLIHFVHAHVRSARVSIVSGSMNHSMTSSTFCDAGRVLSCSDCSLSGDTSGSLMSGRALWLHFPTITGPRSMSSPGLLLMTVLRVVSSVFANGYSAPVMSCQCCMAFPVLAVRQ